jgi:hypothetical protein
VTDRRGTWLNAAWGFAEGTLFFVVPDVAFTWTSLEAPRRGLARMGAAIGGALAAGALLYAWAAARPAEARAAVAAVPFVGEKMISPAEARWETGGTATLFANPLNGVPYKVYAVLAPERLSLAAFLLLSVPLRAERMMLSWIVFAAAAVWLRRRAGPARRRAAVAFHAGFWLLVYAVYWTVHSA